MLFPHTTKYFEDDFPAFVPFWDESLFDPAVFAASLGVNLPPEFHKDLSGLHVYIKHRHNGRIYGIRRKIGDQRLMPPTMLLYFSGSIPFHWETEKETPLTALKDGIERGGTDLFQWIATNRN